MPEMPQSEIDALGGFRFLASKYGGTPQSIEKKITDLEQDNREQRVEINTLKEQLPKADHVVVPKAEIDKLAEYEAIGKPAEIKTKLETGQQTEQELRDIQTRTAAEKFAKAAGLADEAVDTLVAIPTLKNAKFEVRKGKVKNDKGAEVDGDVAYITLEGEGKTAMSFEKAVEAVPALKGLARATGGTPPTGVLYVPQGGDGKGGNEKSTVVDEEIKRIRARAEAPNALRPAPVKV